MESRGDSRSQLLARYHDIKSPQPFQWQVPPPTASMAEILPHTRWAQLEDDLAAWRPERRQYRDTLAESTHTEFQEQREGLSARPSVYDGVDEYDPPLRLSSGYMHSAGPFSLDRAPMNEQSFLEWYPKGQATIHFPDEDGDLRSVSGINAWIIEERCPLLAAAFEDSRSGPQLHLEALDETTVWPFLRYLYTGSYALVTASGNQSEDVPTSVLLHCRLYRLADIYDLPELKSQAYVNVLRQCEFGCSSPNVPIDLCAAIRFIYAHLPRQEQLIDAIVNYCVNCYQQHQLGSNADFKELACSLRPFYQALSRNSMGRVTEHETAAAIIQLPFRAPVPDTYASREGHWASRDDVVYHFHASDEPAAPSRKRTHISAITMPRKSALTMALRQKLQKNELEAEEPVTSISGAAAASSNRENPLEAKASEPEAVQSSDDDYDLVARPAAVEVLSTDDESEIAAAAPGRSAKRPVRGTLSTPSRCGANPIAPVEIAGGDSDSDWTVV
ncbi:hypothetical protein LTR53_012901 [Teratosphaeriaceae sp. CCFEE 6253]|nr:hypothetical protein LTR53_012901 [Teratosphaeriaceae sp. CCFEE 6253]